MMDLQNIRRILEKSLNELKQGITTLTVNTREFMLAINSMTMELLGKPLAWTQEEQYIADLILRISNICYNNTSNTVLPLDDGLYDQLLVDYKRYNPYYQVGAEPIKFAESTEQEFNQPQEKKLLYHTVPDKALDGKLYARMIQLQHTPLNSYIRPAQVSNIDAPMITKRMINTEHKYPELVGTLDKCKFVLTNDAYQAGAIDNPAVQIFERDYIHPCLSSGIIQPNEVFEMVGELKYDGISVEAEVLGDEIISAYSRGDTGENIATDLTPILKNYRFYNASKVPKDMPFGIKFEAVITRRNLELLAQARGKEYKNGRNAIIGLFGASDAFRFVNFITLIPISTSMQMNRIDELTFLNKYYNCGEYNRYCTFKGNYQEILYQVKQFTESAETIRPILPYMIDGVVISFMDPNKIAALGRVNSVNKYQMAIKFNPREVRTIFLNYSYSIGKSGEVIPMVHFKPAEFIGTIHTKQTIHSLQRFKELHLIPGQEIDVKYVNDVLTYVTKPDTLHNRQLEATGKYENFITHCPYCGAPIEISDSGKSARCPNVNCHERRIMRMVDMFDKLNFKDIAEETIRLLDLTSFTQLVQPWSKRALDDKIGPLTADKFMNYCQSLTVNEIPDYKIMAALCFEGMAEEKWKNILKVYDLRVLAQMSPDQLRVELSKISGVGLSTIQAIIDGFTYYNEEVRTVLEKIKFTDSRYQAMKPKVALTGTRDPIAINLLNEAGYDCDEKYGVTKDTALLLTNDMNSNSTKMQKAKKYGIPIFTIPEFFKRCGIQYVEF